MFDKFTKSFRKLADKFYADLGAIKLNKTSVHIYKDKDTGKSYLILERMSSSITLPLREGMYDMIELWEGK